MSQLLTEQEAAEYIVMRQARMEGVRENIRYALEDLQNWIKQNRVEPH